MLDFMEKLINRSFHGMEIWLTNSPHLLTLEYFASVRIQSTTSCIRVNKDSWSEPPAGKPLGLEDRRQTFSTVRMK
jgi:hypothetical protein